ncbi:hypothetical protein [Azospirillum argentinense]|uniref:hypothetical protein n=1 Tax=Azospirillum argentinense TaxID=2970906 RepID=UPI0010C13471|nr:hypothetical protein [Azospirillum argentinense]
MRLVGRIAIVIIMAGFLTPLLCQAQNLSQDLNKWGMQIHQQEGSINLYGDCGPASVSMLGINRAPDIGLYFGSNGLIRIINYVKDVRKIVDFNISNSGLGDFNRVYCAKSKLGSVFVVFAECMGFICNDQGVYHIVKLEDMTLLTGRPEENKCRDECPSNILDMNIRDILDNAWQQKVNTDFSQDTGRKKLIDPDKKPKTESKEPWYIVSLPDKDCFPIKDVFDGAEAPEQVAKIFKRDGGMEYSVNYKEAGVVLLKNKRNPDNNLAIIQGKNACLIGLKLMQGR